MSEPSSSYSGLEEETEETDELFYQEIMSYCVQQ